MGIKWPKLPVPDVIDPSQLTNTGFTMQGDVRSFDWDGSSDLSSEDTTATQGFYLDSSEGAAQFEGNVFGLPWADWTPTFPGMTEGNGTYEARFVQIGKTVHGWFDFNFGYECHRHRADNFACHRFVNLPSPVQRYWPSKIQR